MGQISMHTTSPARGNHFPKKSHGKSPERVTSANQENQGRLLARGAICGMNRISTGGRWEKVSKRTEVYLNQSIRKQMKLFQ